MLACGPAICNLHRTGGNHMSTYDTADPRAALSKQKSAVPPAVEFAAAEYAKFYETAPQDDDANGKTWYARGQNFIIAYTEAKPGATFARKGQIDEYVVLLHDAPTTADFTAGAETKSIAGYTVTFVPPGDSSVTLPKGRRLREAASEHPAVPGLAGAEGRLPDPLLQPRLSGRGRPLRPHLPLHDLHG